MKKLYYSLLFLCCLSAIKAQVTTVLVYSEDFQGTQQTMLLNDGTSAVSSNTGRNNWIVNSLYTGAPVYTNTISQDSTFGGLISFAPFSKYLHIHDSVAQAGSGVANANWSTAQASDRLASTPSFCTLGLTNVKIAFYFLCEGNAQSYGQLYYSADGGPWTAVGQPQYNNTYKWKYEEVSNPAFNNLQSLRFAFRWVNSTGGSSNASFAVDDIRVVGDYDPTVYPVTIQIDSVGPNPVCQGNNLFIFYSFSQPLCGTGNYAVQLSNASGSFTNPVGIPGPNSVFVLSNQFDGIIAPQIPGSTTPGTCYKVRIIRTDVVPNIIGEASVCFEIQDCPNTITTLQPVVLSNPLDTICVGSVIDIPFYSTGVFTNNTYVAQLSDSSGNFPPNPNVLGTFPNSQTYDPTLGSPPGSVSGLIQPLFQPIPPGCNYYIRINGINPATTGSLYGPFCIRECDITTNNKQDIKACIDDINGLDTLLDVDINTFDPAIIYNPGNQFGIQVLSSQTFGIVAQASYPNQPWIGTAVNSVTNTQIPVSVPNIPNLPVAGLQAGMYYIRAISTSSSQPWNQLGTLVRLTIGAPNPQPIGIYAFPINPPYVYIPPTPDTTICVNEGFYFYPTPYNFQSTYQWALNTNPNWSSESSTGIIFNGAGVYNLTVRETNFGCAGPGSDTAKITVIGQPAVGITGPTQVCLGDTVQFTVPLQNNTYYAWSCAPSSVIDTANNITTIYASVAGSNMVTIQAVNQCGTNTATKTVLVRPNPDMIALADTSICIDTTQALIPITLTGSEATGATVGYVWTSDGSTVGNTSSITVTPDSTTTYVLTGSKTWGGTAKCSGTDTVTITVNYSSFLPTIDTTVCEKESMLFTPGAPGNSYLWSDQSTGTSISVSDTGIYSVQIISTAAVCPSKQIFILRNKECYKPLILPNIFTPDGNGINDAYGAISTFKYESFFIEIYNRWGNLVYRSEDPFFQWDGTTFTGERASDGTYFYIAALKSGDKSDTQKGTVTLVSK